MLFCCVILYALILYTYCPAGSVILESPVLPVKEGDHVSLHCKKKKSSADLIADFYKDGLRIRTGYRGNMTIYNVSKSDEGLYKCNISGAGQSPESLLAVRGETLLFFKTKNRLHEMFCCMVDNSLHLVCKIMWH